MQFQLQALDLTGYRGSFCLVERIRGDSVECVDEFRVVKKVDWLVDVIRIRRGRSEVYATLPRYIGFITCGSSSYTVLVAYTPYLSPKELYGRIVRWPKFVEAVCRVGDCRHPGSMSFKMALNRLVPIIRASGLSPGDFDYLVRALGSNPVVGILNAFRAGECWALEYCKPL